MALLENRQALAECFVQIERLTPSFDSQGSGAAKKGLSISTSESEESGFSSQRKGVSKSSPTSTLRMSPQDENFQEDVRALLEDEETPSDRGDDTYLDDDTGSDDVPLALRKQELHKSVSEANQTKRLDFLLKQAEVFSHFMRPTYTAALKELQPDTADNSKKRKHVGKEAKRKETMKKTLAARAQEKDNSDSEDDEKDRAHVFSASPSFIRNGVMRDYQVKGLNWLISLYNNGINGILADEMGLGKTIQTIALLGYLKHDRKVSGPHLIIAPKSTLSNWMNEFAKWCPTLKTICLIGYKDERRAFIKSAFYRSSWDVCVTSYDIVRLEFHTLKKVGWVYVVVDEAQRVKNEEATLSRLIRFLKSQSRLLLTGTPLQNNLHELWSLLNYLLPDVFDSAEEFDTWFSMDACAQDSTLVTRLHTLLRPFLLRRVKSDVEKSLPPKREMRIYVSLTPMQREWYRNILMKEIDVLADKGFTRLMNVLMHLRKVCNHPYLFPGAEEGPPYTTDTHLVEKAGKMRVLDKLLERLRAEGSRVLLFSQFTTMLDIIEDYCAWRGFEMLRLDGNVAHEKRQRDIDEFNAPNSSKFIFLLSTRAGGLGINLVTADVVILYDSDWNPQVDLQAQDRCHRIGQTKEVRVFRFVTDNTVEEKIQQIAQKKLWLDRAVIQQGRLADVGSTKLGVEKLRTIIKHGAEDILHGKSVVSTDEDIDEILRKSKEKDERVKEILGMDDDYEARAQNFAVEDPSVYDIHHFEGQDFRQLRKEKQRMSTSTVTNKDNLSNKAGPPEEKFDFQFFPHRYYELIEKETDYYRKLSRQKPYVQFFADELLSLNDIREIKYAEQERIRQAEPLTEEETEEKAKLEEEGFPSWDRKAFTTYLKLLQTHGGDNLTLISNSVRGKSTEEVVAYHQVFTARSHEIHNYEEIYTKYGLETLVSECNSRIEGLLDLKVSQCPRQKKQLKIKYPPSGAGSLFSKEDDRALLMDLHDVGPRTSRAFEALCFRIQASSKHSLFLRSRNSKVLHARCCFLLHCIQSEVNQSQGSVESGSQYRNSPESGRGVVEIDLTPDTGTNSSSGTSRKRKWLPDWDLESDDEPAEPKKSRSKSRDK